MRKLRWTTLAVVPVAGLLLIHAQPGFAMDKTTGTAAPKAAGQMQTTKPGPKAPVTGGVHPTTAIPLTTSECTSLGGRVDDSSAACTNAGQFTCKTVTVDASGATHVNTACIDNK